MRILGIETSCDETAAAVVEGPAGAAAPRLRASVVASQMAEHRPYGGVVPEIASRSHIRFITGVVERALAGARTAAGNIDAVAVTAGPGLPGSLLVGLTAAKALAYLWRRPLVAVNHIEAHVYAAFLSDRAVRPPLLALVASGGHTELLHMPRHGTFRVLGATRDDAAGEAYDKVAKWLGLGYPGGPALERLARRPRGRAVRLPVARMKDGSLDFSFSGLKTAVTLVRGAAPAAVAAGFQRAVIDALVGRTGTALSRTRARRLVLAGGVASNGALRGAFADLARSRGVALSVPPPELCTDNAAMIACAGWYAVRRRRFASLKVPAAPGWRTGSTPPR